MQYLYQCLFLFLFYLPVVLSARQIDTFYGSIEVEEPVLLELIDSPAFQRLKSIHQYGVAYYTTHREEYTRYDHSLGVFTILRIKGASLEEQIAGLLHDVSHTAFSHVGDWIFGKENQEKDYQSSIHVLFLDQSGLGAILNKYNFTSDQFLPTEELFPALECPLPNLCADRIDYNIQGAYYQGFLSYEEALTIAKDLQFIDNTWVSTNEELMKKLTRFSIFMTQDCWGSPTNYVSSRWLADAILRAFDLGCISHEEIHFGIDQTIWNKLLNHEDHVIQQKMRQLLQAKAYYSHVHQSEADVVVISKFRGINPWMMVEEKKVRLTSLDPELAEEYQDVQQVMKNGWPIKILLSPLSESL